MVQDLATQWLQSYPCTTKTSVFFTEELTEVLGADEEKDQSGPAPMEVGFVGKKGKKGKGKQQQSKGGGKQNKGKDKQLQDKNQPKAHEWKGHGKPEQSKHSSSKFQGYCGNCCKWGHPQRECWGKSINNLADSTSASSSSRVDTYNSSSEVKVVLLAICGSRMRSTTISGSSQWAWQDGLRDSRDVQASGARFSSIVAARRQCAARSIFRTIR